MTTQAKKVVVANYSEAVLASLVKDYQDAYALNPDNATILTALSTKYGKTVHSLRAKLSSLKVYKSATTATAKPTVTGQKKEDIVNAISHIVGQELQGLEVAPKNTLLALLSFASASRDKIAQLIDDLTEERLYGTYNEIDNEIE